MLAGCSASPDPALPPVEVLGPPARIIVSWENVTWESICTVPAGSTCGVSNHEFNEWRLQDVGSDLWLNFTWEANDEANRELTVSYGSGEQTGPSPLSIHVDEPEEEITITVSGKITSYFVAYEDAPPQEFMATASYLAVASFGDP
jgi:hypothetical protein